jgi:predicted thioredoxin/glutaredoxin
MGIDAGSRLTVVHRQECELCDEMLAELEALKQQMSLPPIEVVDVDADPQLARRYGLHVPVLLLDGTVVCRHRLDAAELKRLLRSRDPSPEQSANPIRSI